MAITVTFQGTDYTLPTAGESDDWGDALDAFLVAVAAAFPSTKLTATATASVAAFSILPSAQPTGPNVVGDVYMAAGGVMKVCTVAGTPGTWVSVGAQT